MMGRAGPLVLATALLSAAAPPSALGPVMTIGRLHYEGGGDW